MRCGSAREAARPCSAVTTSASSRRASGPTSPSGARTDWSSAGPRIPSRDWSSPARTASTASTWREQRSSTTGTSSAPTRTRSRANIAATRKDSRRERFALDARPRRGARPPGERRPRRALARRAPHRRGDGRRRPHRRARLGARARRLPAPLPPAVTVHQRRRDRGRAVTRPLTRTGPDLVLLMHDISWTLTVEELAELFEGRTRLVERLAELDDTPGSAHEVIRNLRA